jgi:hypothetical protein
MTSLRFELDTARGTDSSGVEAPPSPTTTIASITRSFGMLRDETSVLDQDVGDSHRAAQLQTLDLLAHERAREDVPGLLDELSTQRGLGWSDIARLVGVSVQALRKWRRREPMTGENRFAVARLTALLDLLQGGAVQDPGGWLEVPLAQGYSLRHLDLYRRDRADLLFDLAHLRITPEQALAELDPEWREHFRLDHEIFDPGDGQLSIRRRS